MRATLTPGAATGRNSSILFDASAFVRLSSNCSPVSLQRVSRYDRWAAVIGSSPVFHSSGSRRSALDVESWLLMTSEIKAKRMPVVRLKHDSTSVKNRQTEAGHLITLDDPN